MIYYPKMYGTCSGANKAIQMAYKLKDEFKDKKIYIYKEILHNQYIIDELAKNGIKTIEDYNLLTKDDILIIRAHGESKNTYDELNKKGITYYDATCINVSKIHSLVENKYNEGFNIVIVGKKSHPEVNGTNGWCNNSAIIIETLNDLKKLNKNDKYYLVSKKTISVDLFNDVINYLKEKNYNFEYDNTICNHQKLIQSSSIELAKDMDVMFVIGGEKSSNTKELFNECSKVCESHFFSNLTDFYNFIKKQNYTLKTKIGITGGASTLKTQIYEFTHLLEFTIYYNSRYKDIIKEMNKFNNSLKQDDNEIVKDVINKFINMNSDGKCLRGCLIDLGYKLSKDDDYALALSCAYETFETSILIHDDIIDNSILRRGKETISYSYEKEFKKYNSSDNTPYHLALCAGDIGFFYTNELINKKYKNDKNFSKLLSYYNNIVINTIKGEIIDVYLPFIESHDKNHLLKESDILEIYKLKTSHYTIVGPFILGMILGNSSQKDIDKLSKILEPLGMAFQIKDDILGIFSDINTIGKSVISDIEEFKQTILYSYIKINKQDYLDDLLKYYGKKNLTNEELIKVQRIINESGSLQYAKDKMDEMFYITKTNIQSLNIKENVKNILLGFITYLELREK